MNRAACEEFDGARVFAGGSARTLQADLASDDFLQRKGDFRRDIANERDRATFADAVDGGGDGFVAAHSFNGQVHTGAGGAIADVGGEIRIGEEGFRGAGVPGELQAGFVDVSDEDARATGSAERLESEEADGARAEDESCGAGGNGSERNGVNGDSDCFKHGSFCKREIRRETVDDAGGDDDELGEGTGTAIIGAGNAEDLTAVAEIDFAAQAVAAGAAIDGGIEGDAIAFGETGDAEADRGDVSGGFVTHDDRRNAAPRRAIVAVDIAAADAASGHAHENFAGSGRGNGRIDQFEMTVLGEKQSLHRRDANSVE